MIGTNITIVERRKKNSEELNNSHKVIALVSTSPGIWVSSRRPLAWLLHREEPVEGHHGNDQQLLMRQEAEALGSHTHLRVEWELHMGLLPEAELGEVIENCQEMVIWCCCVFITDA